MKKALPLFVVLVFLLSACGGLTLPGSSAATSSSADSDMATRVAGILTAMPTVTGQAPEQATEAPTEPVEPTLAPTTEVPTATQAPTATVPLPSETPAPTATGEVPQGTPTENLTPVASFTPAGGTPQSGATPAPTTAPSGDDPRVKLGTPAWTDTMDNSNNWPTGDSEYTKIDFSDGSLLLTPLKTTAGWRLTWTKIADAYVEMSVRSGKCSGNDYYGIIFRVPDLNDPDQGYLLSVSCEGKYSLRLWDGRDGAKGKMTTLIPWTTSDKIVAGADQLNRVGAMMIGDRLLVYINGTMIKEVKDSAFKEGYFGLFAAQGSDQKEFTTRVEEMSLWNNPQP